MWTMSVDWSGLLTYGGRRPAVNRRKVGGIRSRPGRGTDMTSK